MQKILLSILFFLPFFINAQEETTGIHFEQELNWQQILSKAKAENKYIFVDCYATWCGPCKKMDKEVYPRDSAGNFMNPQFVSVKVQMDTSREDNAKIKNWYSDAHFLQKEYKVGAFPTYLFFSPEGKIVQKEVGAKNLQEFILFAASAKDPKQQFFTVMNNYKEGRKDYPPMGSFAITAKAYGYNDFSTVLAKDYIENYLNKMDSPEQYRKEDFEFMASSIEFITSKDKIFSTFYHYPARTDRAMAKMSFDGHAKDFVNAIIYNEEIYPVIVASRKGGGDPNWEKIEQTIKTKYEAGYAKTYVTQSRISWYLYKKNWRNYTKYIVLRVEDEYMEHKEQNVLNMFFLNNNAFEIFKYSNDTKDLEKALSWVDEALPMISNPDVATMDTKANLLYKLGRKEEALKLEAETAALAPKYKEIQENFEKMKKGLPTWPDVSQ